MNLTGYTPVRYKKEVCKEHIVGCSYCELIISHFSNFVKLQNQARN